MKEIRDALGRVLHRAHTYEVMEVEEGSTVEVRVPIFHEQQGIISIYKKRRNTEAVFRSTALAITTWVTGDRKNPHHSPCKID